MSVAIAVLGRAPEQGRVKTRLARTEGDEQALLAYRCMLHATLANAVATGLPVHLVTTDSDHPDIVRLSRAFRVSCMDQEGGDLGERMQAVFACLLAQYRRVLLVGTDCPWLNTGHYWQALGLLGGADVALLGARDGGYVLIGARSDERWQGGSPFCGVRFGTGWARQDTLESLGRAGFAARVTGSLPDIDTVEHWHSWITGDPAGVSEAKAFWEQGAA